MAESTYNYLACKLVFESDFSDVKMGILKFIEVIHEKDIPIEERILLSFHIPNDPRDLPEYVKSEMILSNIFTMRAVRGIYEHFQETLEVHIQKINELRRLRNDTKN